MGPQRGRDCSGRRPEQLQVHLDHRAPLPRRVFAHVGQRGGGGVGARQDGAHPRGVGDLQPQPPGQPSGSAGRAGGDARPAQPRAVRVRHGTGSGEPRDRRLRSAARRDQGKLGRGDHGNPEDVAAAGLFVPQREELPSSQRRAADDARPRGGVQRPAQALRPYPSRAVGRRGESRARTRRRRRWGWGCWGSTWGRCGIWSRCSPPTRNTSATRSRSATTSTTTS